MQWRLSIISCIAVSDRHLVCALVVRVVYGFTLLALNIFCYSYMAVLLLLDVFLSNPPVLFYFFHSQCNARTVVYDYCYLLLSCHILL